MAHGFSEGEPLRFHITMHRVTAPKDIHIFTRLTSSDSGTFSRHGTFTPSLDKVSANDRPLYTQIGSNACIFNRDWLQILQPRFSLTSLQLLKRDITGLSGKFSFASCSNLSDGLTLRWADIFYNHNILLCIDWQNFLLVQIETRGYQTINYHIVYIHTFSLTLILSNFDEFVCQQKHQHDISRIRWGVELKISSFQIFKSLSCLKTNIFYLTLNVT